MELQGVCRPKILATTRLSISSFFSGAELAIRQAIANAGISPDRIGYINLHGTATEKNDEMESRVVESIFGLETPCSSTKSQIGHTLGAAGAQEIGFCWLLLDEHNRDRRLPRHLWDGEADPELPAIALTSHNAHWHRDLFMSNSFAFGGSNVSVIIGYAGMRRNTLRHILDPDPARHAIVLAEGTFATHCNLSDQFCLFV